MSWSLKDKIFIYLICKAKIVIYVIVIIGCALLFYFVLNSAKKSEREEFLKKIEISNSCKQKAIKNGFFIYDSRYYKVVIHDPNSLK